MNRAVGNREPPCNGASRVCTGLHGSQATSRLAKGWRNADCIWCILAFCITENFLFRSLGRIPTHFARCCQDCMSGTSLRLACALRIAGFNVGWALQECTPACCFARLCASALSNTHFCRVPDSCPTPQARLPRLTGPCEPLFAKCSFIYGKVAGLPDCQP